MLFHFDRDLVGLLSQAVCLTDFIVIVPTQSDCEERSDEATSDLRWRIFTDDSSHNVGDCHARFSDFVGFIDARNDEKIYTRKTKS